MDPNFLPTHYGLHPNVAYHTPTAVINIYLTFTITKQYIRLSNDIVEQECLFVKGIGLRTTYSRPQILGLHKFSPYSLNYPSLLICLLTLPVLRKEGFDIQGQNCLEEQHYAVPNKVFTIGCGCPGVLNRCAECIPFPREN